MWLYSTASTRISVWTLPVQKGRERERQNERALQKWNNHCRECNYQHIELLGTQRPGLSLESFCCRDTYLNSNLADMKESPVETGEGRRRQNWTPAGEMWKAARNDSVTFRPWPAKL